MQSGVFYVFYDKYQLVHRREIPDWVQNADCRLVLRRNCRSTKKIVTTAAKSIDVEHVPWEQSPPGNTPNFYIMDDPESLRKKLGELISKYVDAQIPLDQITILTARTEDKSVLTGVQKVGKWLIANVRRDDAILFTTVRKFKGLESAAVIMVDVDAATFETPESRNLFYVGASRAKHFLDIVTILDDAQLEALCNTLSNQPGKGAAKIASALKVRIVKESKGEQAVEDAGVDCIDRYMWARAETSETGGRVVFAIMLLAPCSHWFFTMQEGNPYYSSYMICYNHQRRHCSTGHMAPVVFYAAFLSSKVKTKPTNA